MKYRHIVNAFNRTPWAIIPEKLMEIAEFLSFAADGGKFSREEIEARIDPRAERRIAQANGNVMVIPMVGVISHRGSGFEDVLVNLGVSTEKMAQQFRAAMADSDIKAVVLDVDSPGGLVDGVEELSSEIFKARGPKPIVAVANSLMASAAYWIGTAADEVIVTPSGEVGSVGVWNVHIDERGLLEKKGVKATIFSAGKFKLEAHPFQELTDTAREHIQEQVDHFYGMFVDAVARNRNVSPKEIQSGFGEGRAMPAPQAVKMGMADRVGTLKETIERFGVSGTPSSRNTRGAHIERLKRELRYEEIMHP